MFRRWRLSELESGRWDDAAVRQRVAPNIAALVDHNILVARWVASEIVLTGANTKRRVKTLTYFVDLAEACRALCNFNGMFAIFVGLGHPAIRRLEATHKALSRAVQQRHHALEELCSESGNFRAYRSVLAAASQPLVPIAMPLLRAVATNQEVATPDGAPKMDTLRALAGAYRAVLDARRTPYAFKRSPQLQALLQHGLVTTTTSLARVMELSNICEPPLDAVASVVAGVAALQTSSPITPRLTSTGSRVGRQSRT